MNKRILSLVLALVMVLGTFGSVFAAETKAEEAKYTTADQKVQWLKDNKVVEGRKIFKDGKEDVDFALDENVTRAEITKLVVYTLRLENLADALKGADPSFPDVRADHWANGYVTVATTTHPNVAHGRRIVIGYPDGNFYPENNVTYAELAVMLVRIVKEDLTEANEKFANAPANWPSQWMAWAKAEGILDGLTIADSNKAAPREDAFVMIFNAMTKLGNTERSAAQYGDQLGVISKLQSGKIEINEDKVYDINFNTMVTDGTSWSNIGENTDRLGVGSLVRLIVDENGVVTHLLELGNPRQLAIDYHNKPANLGNLNARWFSVAESTIGTVRGTVDGRPEPASYEYASIKGSYSNPKAIVVRDVEARIDKDTRFFVADVNNAHFTEVKSLNDIFADRIMERNEIPRVYMGYDVFNGVAEAEVIVFHVTDKYAGVSGIRRVVAGGQESTKYMMTLENTKGEREHFDLAKTPLFPANQLAEYRDVIDLRIDNYNSQMRHEGRNILIDHSADPVYEVTYVNQAKRAITLKDKDGYTRDFYLPSDAYIFLEGELAVGKHVQIYPNNIEQTKYNYGVRNHAYGESDRNFDLRWELDVVSVVDKDLKGILDRSVRPYDVSGWITEMSMSPDLNSYTVTIVNGNGRNAKSYQVATTENDWLVAYRNAFMTETANNVWKLNSGLLGKKGTEVVAFLTEKYGQTDYIYHIEYMEKIDQNNADKTVAEKAVNAYERAIADYAKALIEAKKAECNLPNYCDCPEYNDAIKVLNAKKATVTARLKAVNASKTAAQVEIDRILSTSKREAVQKDLNNLVNAFNEGKELRAIVEKVYCIDCSSREDLNCAVCKKLTSLIPTLARDNEFFDLMEKDVAAYEAELKTEAMDLLKDAKAEIKKALDIKLNKYTELNTKEAKSEIETIIKAALKDKKYNNVKFVVKYDDAYSVLLSTQTKCDMTVELAVGLKVTEHPVTIALNAAVAAEKATVDAETTKEINVAEKLYDEADALVGLLDEGNDKKTLVDLLKELKKLIDNKQKLYSAVDALGTSVTVDTGKKQIKADIEAAIGNTFKQAGIAGVTADATGVENTADWTVVLKVTTPDVETDPISITVNIKGA